MKIRTTPRFERAIKKLHPAEKKSLDEAVRAVVAEPGIGDMKKGDLAGVRVYKYRFNNGQMLLAYSIDSEQSVMVLMGYGTHENFYRDLKH